MGRQNGSNHCIKIQKHTPSKPEIRLLARECGISHGDAFLAWFRLYATLDELTDDGWVEHYTPEDADADAGQPGAARALVKAGWLIFDNRGCTVANWERHCGSGAKRRAVVAERVWRHREHHRNAADVTHKPLQM